MGTTHQAAQAPGYSRLQACLRRPNEADIAQAREYLFARVPDLVTDAIDQLCLEVSKRANPFHWIQTARVSFAGRSLFDFTFKDVALLRFPTAEALLDEVHDFEPVPLAALRELARAYEDALRQAVEDQFGGPKAVDFWGEFNEGEGLPTYACVLLRPGVFADEPEYRWLQSRRTAELNWMQGEVHRNTYF